MKKAFLKNQQGFTLMEVMVAVSIFAIVVTVGIGSLLTINSTYRKSQIDRQAIDSLTFTLESMSREIRTAATWNASYNAGATSSFQFKDQDGADVTYSWVGDGLFKDYQCTACQNQSLPNSNGQPYDMTPGNVKITKMSFLPLESTNGQPYVQVNIDGQVTSGKETTDFAFQTGVSKRTLD